MLKNNAQENKSRRPTSQIRLTSNLILSVWKSFDRDESAVIDWDVARRTHDGRVRVQNENAMCWNSRSSV